MQLLLNELILKFLSPKMRKREKEEKSYRSCSYKSPGSHFNLKEKKQWMLGIKQWQPDSLPEPLWSEAIISDQNISPQYLEDNVLIANSGSHKPFPECRHCCLLWGSLPNGWNWLKLIIIYQSDFPWKLQLFEQNP